MLRRGKVDAGQESAASGGGILNQTIKSVLEMSAKGEDGHVGLLDVGIDDAFSSSPLIIDKRSRHQQPQAPLPDAVFPASHHPFKRADQEDPQ